MNLRTNDYRIRFRNKDGESKVLYLHNVASTVEALNQVPSGAEILNVLVLCGNCLRFVPIDQGCDC